MPTSTPDSIENVISVVWRLAPKSVLDLGAGYGKYGVLFREYLEMKHTTPSPGELRNVESTLWKVRLVQIDAVEGFREYIGPLHEVVYDNIYVESIADSLKRQWEYDFIFMGDVLEHLDKQEALIDILPLLVQRARMGVLISLPARHSQQPAEFGNEYEIHRSHWTMADFAKLAPFVHGGISGTHLMVFLATRPEPYRVVRGKPWKRKVRKVMSAFGKNW